jgi:hypothetical protein
MISESTEPEPIPLCTCDPGEPDYLCEPCRERSRRWRAWVALRGLVPGGDLPPEADAMVFASVWAFARPGGTRYTIRISGGHDGEPWYVYVERDGRRLVDGQIQAVRAALRAELEEHAAMLGATVTWPEGVDRG